MGQTDLVSPLDLHAPSVATRGPLKSPRDVPELPQYNTRTVGMHFNTAICTIHEQLACILTLPFMQYTNSWQAEGEKEEEEEAEEEEEEEGKPPPCGYRWGRQI